LLKIKGLVYHFTRGFEEAAEQFKRGAEAAEAAGVTYEVALARHNAGDALHWIGRYDEALECFESSLRFCEEQGRERLGMHNRMYIEFLRAVLEGGDPLPQLEKLIESANERGYIWDVLDGKCMIARWLLHTGQIDAVIEPLRQLSAAAEDQGMGLLEDFAAEQLAKLGVGR
jgi:tetratricopeptide (TPR) repeat protein